MDDKEVANGKEEASIGASKCYPPAEAEYQQVVENADLFLRELINFNISFTTKFISPTVGGIALDLHRLFVEVTSRGGLNQVIRDRKWEEVVSAFKPPMTSISRSFLLRKFYVALLYHFEQVYFFRKSAPTVPITDAVNYVPDTGTAADSITEVFKESTTVSHLPGGAQIQSGVTLVGIIDEKFDNGYVVSVNMGSDKLKGIIYHIPDSPQSSWSPNPHISQHRKRKKSHLTLLDPSKPKPTRNSYNFTEHYASLAPMSQGHEERINKKIGHLWNKLSETEQFCEDKEIRDQTHNSPEMVEYNS